MIVIMLLTDSLKNPLVNTDGYLVPISSPRFSGSFTVSGDKISFQSDSIGEVLLTNVQSGSYKVYVHGKTFNTPFTINVPEGDGTLII